MVPIATSWLAYSSVPVSVSFTTSSFGWAYFFGNPQISRPAANNLKADYYKALLKIPEAQLSDYERSMRDSLADLPEITILQMIYQQKAYEGDSKDYEFSATSMREHWQSGLEDTRGTLKRRDWLALPAD